MGSESSGVDVFDLGPLLQGQMRIAKLKSGYLCFIQSTSVCRDFFVTPLEARVI